MLLASWIITLTLSGVAGLAILLEALRRLLKEGKISKALSKAFYKIILMKIMQIAGKVNINLPLPEEFFNDWNDSFI